MSGLSERDVERLAAALHANLCMSDECEHSDMQAFGGLAHDLAPVVAAIRAEAVRYAIEVERGPHPCCPHCKEDRVHDVEPNQHDLPCQTCTHDAIRDEAKAEAWDEAYARGVGDEVRGEWSDNPYRALLDGGEDK